MADVQKQFDEYHGKIKLSGEKEILQEKRDKLKENLEANLAEDAPKIEKYLLQGSYKIHTGINPPHYEGNPNLDYDIDVGVVFDCTCDDYTPIKLKEMVRDALNHPSRDPAIKTPCITVQYIKDGKKDYHVDMPVYVKRADGNGYDLAWGKSTASEEWKHSDPEGLVNKINDKFGDETKRTQFRRIVKYLKVWKSKKFPGAPSIGITLGVWNALASNLDSPYEDKPNDLVTLRDTIQKMLNQFSFVKLDENNTPLYRYKVLLPVTPQNDVFEKLTDKQMTELKTKLEALKDDLTKAHQEDRPEKACEILAKHFDSFPIPPAEETARASVKSMNNTGSSS